MKAKEAKLLNFLQTAPQLVIPIYQRIYSWSLKECEQLWDDILRCGLDENNQGHFIGSVVYCIFRPKPIIDSDVIRSHFPI